MKLHVVNNSKISYREVIFQNSTLSRLALNILETSPAFVDSISENVDISAAGPINLG